MNFDHIDFASQIDFASPDLKSTASQSYLTGSQLQAYLPHSAIRIATCGDTVVKAARMKYAIAEVVGTNAAGNRNEVD